MLNWNIYEKTQNDGVWQGGWVYPAHDTYGNKDWCRLLTCNIFWKHRPVDDNLKCLLASCDTPNIKRTFK